MRNFKLIFMGFALGLCAACAIGDGYHTPSPVNDPVQRLAH